MNTVRLSAAAFAIATSLVAGCAADSTSDDSLAPAEADLTTSAQLKVSSTLPPGANLFATYNVKASTFVDDFKHVGPNVIFTDFPVIKFTDDKFAEFVGPGTVAKLAPVDTAFTIELHNAGSAAIETVDTGVFVGTDLQAFFADKEPPTPVNDKIENSDLWSKFITKRLSAVDDSSAPKAVREPLRLKPGTSVFYTFPPHKTYQIEFRIGFDKKHAVGGYYTGLLMSTPKMHNLMRSWGATF